MGIVSKINNILNSNAYPETNIFGREDGNYGDIIYQQGEDHLYKHEGTYLLPEVHWKDNIKIQDDTYRSIIESISSFRRTDRLGQISRLKLFDTPVPLYFKIFFYFDNNNLLDLTYDKSIFPDTVTNEDETEENSIEAYAKNYRLPDSISYNEDPDTSLLEGTTKYAQSPQQVGMLGGVNTAFNYLLINKEYARAEKLLKFIKILQEISTESPWYFKEISGLQAAVERKEATDKEFKIDEDRHELNIKCLPDAFDTRIATLLDLYRDITYSYEMHKEILPANLRKFDMGIYIFASPNMLFHKIPNQSAAKTKYIGLNQGNTKYFEFHNCEIDYNSSASGYDSISNEEGYTPEFTIKLKYDSVYEERYNNILNTIIGDFYKWDINYNMEDSEYRSDIDMGVLPEIDFSERAALRVEANTTAVDNETTRNGIFKNMLDQAVSKLYNFGLSKLKKLALGNLFRPNLGDVENTLGQIASGNVFGAVNSAKSMIKKDSGPVYIKHKSKTGDGWNLGVLWDTQSDKKENPNPSELW